MIKELSIEEIAVCHGGVNETNLVEAVLSGYGYELLMLVQTGILCGLTGIMNTPLGQKVTMYLILPTVMFMFNKNSIMKLIFLRDDEIVNLAVPIGAH